MEAVRLMAESRDRHLMPRQAWVLDSQPGKVPNDMEATSGVSKVLEVVHVSGSWRSGNPILPDMWEVPEVASGFPASYLMRSG